MAPSTQRARHRLSISALRGSRSVTFPASSVTPADSHVPGGSARLADDVAGVVADAADAGGAGVVGAQHVEGAGFVVLGDDDAEAAAHVEDLVHLLVGDVRISGCDGRPTRSRPSVTVLPESEVEKIGPVTKMPGTSHFSAL